MIKKMKRLLILGVLCLMSLTMSAQRCAVLDFQIGTGVSVEEIDGLTYNFRANFQINGYTMLERARVIRTIETLGFNRTDMTMQQMLKVGRELEAKLVVIGTMNKFMDEYSVDIRAIDVATGVTCANEGATFDKSNYRSSMENLAANLGKKLASGGSTGSGLGITPPQKSVPQGYTDLGLPSGTIWKNFNVTGFYTYDEAISQFGNRLPSKEQWNELKTECQWTWTGNGYKVTGPNGNFISLPAAGYQSTSGGIGSVGAKGYYWSSTLKDSGNAWRFDFSSDNLIWSGFSRQDNGQSVRLIHD